MWALERAGIATGGLKRCGGGVEKRKQRRRRRRLTCELVVGDDRQAALVRDLSPRSLFVQTRMRIALGAEADQVRGMVLKDGLGMAGVGLAIGIIGAYALSGLMESVLYGVESTDLVTFVSVPLLLVGVAAAASLIPALRATRVDPVEVLNEE